MKFMKLGSKPDAFKAEGNSVRFVSSELATDIIINVGEVNFHLHKFPLISKSNHLEKLFIQANEENLGEIKLVDFPGGPRTFEICAKFCYGMTIILNPYNVVAARCGAEYLEMTEDVERGNLIYKIEVFLNSSIFRSWKDSILVLQTAIALLPWSENLKVVARCIDSIASKTSVPPANVTWSYTHNRKLAAQSKITENSINCQENFCSVPRDWWVEDICELDIDLYKRVMLSIKSKGRMVGSVIVEALQVYLDRWLPDSYDDLASEIHCQRYKSLVVTIFSLLPTDKGEDLGCPCSFLLKLLKVSILVKADDSSREELIQRVSSKLDEASVSDLLIPAQCPQTTMYDIELIKYLANRFLMQAKFARDIEFVDKNEEMNGIANEHASLTKFAKLIDGYLSEVSQDPNLTLSSFIALSQSIPELARPDHDALYKAIDIYLKEHPGLTKAERKKLCGLMNVKKLSEDVSMHAAENDRLPVRVVVQVLFGQIKATAEVQSSNISSNYASHSSENSEADMGMKQLNKCKSVTGERGINEGDLQKNRILVKKGRKSRGSEVQLLPSRSRRIFDRLWAVGKGLGDIQSSDTSASSRSPASMIQGNMKSPSSSLRYRRRSIS